MSAMTRCRRCGDHAPIEGEPHELRLVVFDKSLAVQEEVLRLCGRCKIGFETDFERDEYLKAAALV